MPSATSAACFAAAAAVPGGDARRVRLVSPRRGESRSRALGARRAACLAGAGGASGAERRSGHGAGRDAAGESLLHVVFVQPRIHWNTGNMGRTCLGLGATLHLVGPLGFSVDERQVRRAGLDYWQHVDVRVHASWEAFAGGELRRLGGTRVFFTKFGTECAARLAWPRGERAVLVFGSEVDGFDGIRPWLLADGRAERTAKFPMVDDRFRSFNLSTTASMVRRRARAFSFAGRGGGGRGVTPAREAATVF